MAEPTCLPDVFDAAPGRTELVAQNGCTLDGVIVRYGDTTLPIRPGVTGDGVIRLDRVDAHHAAVEVHDPKTSYPTEVTFRTFYAPGTAVRIDPDRPLYAWPDPSAYVGFAVVFLVIGAVVTALRRRDRRRFGDYL